MSDPKNWVTNPPSTIVEVVGTSRETVNGKQGLIVDYVRDRDRYTILLSGDEKHISVKPENLIIRGSLLTEILKELRLSAHEASFRANSIENVQDLMNLTIDDMKELGMKVGERNRLKKWIDDEDEETPSLAEDSSSGSSFDEWTLPLFGRVHETNDISEEMKQQVKRYTVDQNFQDMPTICDCKDQLCTHLFNNLQHSVEFVEEAEKLCLDELMENLKIVVKSRDFDPSFLDKRVNKGAVVEDAVRIYQIIIHRYSHLNCSKFAHRSPTQDEIEDLCEFRLAALEWAAKSSFEDVEEDATKIMDEVDQRIASEQQKRRDCREKVAKGFVGVVAKEVLRAAIRGVLDA